MFKDAVNTVQLQTEPTTEEQYLLMFLQQSRRQSQAAGQGENTLIRSLQRFKS